MDRVSPSLRGRLAYEVHSAWMSSLQVFEGCDNLPDELFINIAMVLKEMVFAPFEVLIEPHHKADSIFVINSGVVMAKGLALVVRGHTLGDEALFAWRNQLPRGYQATSLVQGRAYIMVAQDVLEILHRKQFAKHVSVPLKRVSDGKCKHLLQSFARWAYQAASNADTMEEAIEMLLTELAVVSPTVLAGCVGLMLRLYFRLNSIPYNHDTLDWRLSRMDDVSPVFAKQIVGQMREMDQAAQQWVHERKASSLVRFSGPSALCQVCSPHTPLVPPPKYWRHSATLLTESTRCRGAGKPHLRGARRIRQRVSGGGWRPSQPHERDAEQEDTQKHAEPHRARVADDTAGHYAREALRLGPGACSCVVHTPVDASRGTDA